MESEKAIILDMDGVLLQTHHLHAIAWKRTFDEFFSSKPQGEVGKITEFDVVRDYRKYLDGRPRHEGIETYLSAKGVELPFGGENDSVEQETVVGLGKRKQSYYQDLLSERGPQVYKDSLDAVKKWTNHHIPLAVVSSSSACKTVLRMGNIEIFFDTIIDPQLASKQSLKGKPAPDYFLHGAELLGFTPEDCLVVEDSEAGIIAAKRGGFSKVYGIVHDKDQDRVDELLKAGADKVIFSLTEINEREI